MNHELVEKDYKGIIKKLIHSNWEVQYKDNGKVHARIYFGPFYCVWEGLDTVSLSTVVDFLYEQIVEK